MNTNLGLEQCLTFINCQLSPPAGPLHDGAPRRAVTISRQSGSGGHAVAQRLVALLQAATPNAPCPWAIFDRNLVEKVLADHNLPKRLAHFMPEDRISEMSDTMDELFGLHPPSWTLVRQTSDTILHLAELGNVILIGRGATVITSKLDYVFHVRLVGSLEKRLAHLQQLEQLSQKEARARIEQQDRGRRRYLKKYFGKDIDDPLLYNVVLNTDRTSYDQAAELIASAVLGREVAPALSPA
jgi:hypothetical protein